MKVSLRLRHRIMVVITIGILGCTSESDGHRVPLRVTQAKTPLRLEEIDLRRKAKKVDVPNVVSNRIQELIHEYYLELGGDKEESIFTIADRYVHTFKVSHKHHSAYLTVLKNPVNRLTSKVIFYDQKDRELVDGVVNLNIFAQYHYRDQIFHRSALADKLKLSIPVIDIYSINDNDPGFFLLARLFHNGTSNAYKFATYDLEEGKVDTLITFTQNIQ